LEEGSGEIRAIPRIAGFGGAACSGRFLREEEDDAGPRRQRDRASGRERSTGREEVRARGELLGRLGAGGPGRERRGEKEMGLGGFGLRF
jgi:hypothetical protein